MATVRIALSEDGYFPSRRTFERRLARVPSRLHEQIALVGEHLVPLLDPWAAGGRAVAIDSTPLRARRRLAQARSRGWRGAAYQYRHRSPLDQVGVTRLGLPLQAASRRHRRRGLVALGRRADAGQ